MCEIFQAPNHIKQWNWGHCLNHTSGEDIHKTNMDFKWRGWSNHWPQINPSLLFTTEIYQNHQLLIWQLKTESETDRANTTDYKHVADILYLGIQTRRKNKVYTTVEYKSCTLLNKSAYWAQAAYILYFLYPGLVKK